MSTSYQPPPQSLANLMPPWKRGQSANPGGQVKGTVHADAAYKRLSKLSIDDLRAYDPPNVVEYAVKEAFLRACEAPDWQAAHAALKELADRLDGKPLQTKVVEHTVSGETKQQVIELAYYQLFNDKSEEEALAAIREIYRQKAAGDQGAMMEAVKVAIQADSEAISGYWSDAEKVVLGERVP